MTPSRDKNWRAENEPMDCVAVLTTMRDHVEVARARTFHQAPAKQTFVELTAAVQAADQLGAMLSDCWQRVWEVAQKGREK